MNRYCSIDHCLDKTPNIKTGSKERKLIHYSSAVKFKESHDKIVAQLGALAKAAHGEMDEDLQSKFPFDYNDKAKAFAHAQNRPRVMTALVVDKWVFFSSSLKGTHPFIYNFERNAIKSEVDRVIRDALESCAAAYGGTHRTGATCGEPMACRQIRMSFPNIDIRASQTAVVSWQSKSSERNPNTAGSRFAPPCWVRHPSHYFLLMEKSIPADILPKTGSTIWM